MKKILVRLFPDDVPIYNKVKRHIGASNDAETVRQIIRKYAKLLEAEATA